MCLISGGAWDGTSYAGVWNLNLNNNRTNSNNNVGFRSADCDSWLVLALGAGVTGPSSPSRGAWSHRDVSSGAGAFSARRTLRGSPLSGSHGERQGAPIS